jgi:hypothetical protein
MYFYNKSSSKLLIVKNYLVSLVTEGYFNMSENKAIISFKRRRNNKTRNSANKVYISRPEVEHTNNKINIVFEAFNKKKQMSLKFIKDMYSLIQFKRKAGSENLQPDYKNRLVPSANKDINIFSK